MGPRLVLDPVVAREPQMNAETDRRRCLLVVEDDPAIRDLLVAIVKDAGCDAIHAEDGHDALRLARSARPRLITLDLGLPGLDGRAVLRALKTDPATANILVIVVSTYADQLDPRDQQAAFAIVRKPFDIDDLIRQIARALDAAA